MTIKITKAALGNAKLQGSKDDKWLSNRSWAIRKRLVGSCPKIDHSETLPILDILKGINLKRLTRVSGTTLQVGTARLLLRKSQRSKYRMPVWVNALYWELMEQLPADVQAWREPGKYAPVVFAAFDGGDPLTIAHISGMLMPIQDPMLPTEAIAALGRKKR